MSLLVLMIPVVPVAPMPNFDDIDVDTDLSKDGSADHPSYVLSSSDTESAVVSSAASIEPLAADEPCTPKDHPVKEPGMYCAVFIYVCGHLCSCFCSAL